MVSAESQQAMDAAKKAVLEFMIKNGHHDTTVHEKVAPAVFHETVSRNEHEEVVTAIDREVHVDHWHTSIQPITDSETLEEQHQLNVLPVETREFEHDDREEVKARLDSEAARFRDERVHLEGEHTREVVPVIAGEHIHHHVHEIIQPVVNKQTIEPFIIHTTVRFHEVHHNAATHHATSALPAVSMADFKKQGGVLTGREERYDWFEGEPRSAGSNLGNSNFNNGTNASAANQGSNANDTSGTSSTSKTGAQGASSGSSSAPANNTAPAPSAPAAAPSPSVPERRSSVAAVAAPEYQSITPSAAAVHNASITPGTAQPGSGRWHLFPAQVPTRATQHVPGAMQPMHPAVAHVDQQQRQSYASVANQGQQGPGARPSSEPRR